MISKFLLLATIFHFASLPMSLDAAKICYRCDDESSAGKYKWTVGTLTKCSDVPFEQYAARTSRALGGDLLLCYTKFNDYGAVIKRDAYGFAESYDKKFKCKDRNYVCCKGEFCNKHTIAPCPPSSTPTVKKEVKACYRCAGVEACKPEKLDGSEIRTSSVFGAKNLYCYTKFDPKTGAAVARGGFGIGESFDKNVKCDAKHYLCCYENMCNNQTAGFCVKAQSQDRE